MEHLKAVRAHHYMLLLISAATTALALVPQTVANYRIAYEEIGVLEGLNDWNLWSFVANDLERKIGSEVMGRAERSVVVVVEPREARRGVAFAQIRPERELFTRLLRATYPGQQLSFSSATLGQLANAIDLPLYVPDIDEERIAAVKTCMSDDADEKVIVVHVTLPVEHFDLAVPGEIPEEPEPTAHIAVGQKVCVPLDFAYETFRDLAKELQAFGEDSVLTGMTAQGFRYTVETAGSPLQLSQLSTWRVVQDLTVTEAKRELLTRLESSTGAQTVFGLSLYRSLAVAALPLLVVVIQILLLCHVQAATSRVSHTDLQNFAWIGVYAEPVAQIFTAVSLLVMPSSALYYLLQAAGAPGRLAWGAAGFCAVTGALTYRGTFVLVRTRTRAATSTPTGGRFRRRIRSM